LKEEEGGRPPPPLPSPRPNENSGKPQEEKPLRQAKNPSENPLTKNKILYKKGKIFAQLPQNRKNQKPHRSRIKTIQIKGKPHQKKNPFVKKISPSSNSTSLDLA
jgi:hypothetical protein